MSPKTWEKPLKVRLSARSEGGDVVICESSTTGFFTMCESQSRLSVSLMRHTEDNDVFA
jgi:hypothetical protein